MERPADLDRRLGLRRDERRDRQDLLRRGSGGQGLKLLVDAHALLWAFADDRRLPGATRAAIADPGNRTLVSVVTVWEIEIKRALGRLAAPDDMPEAMAAGAYRPLPMTVDHAVAAGRLPLLHRDPFDRMLVAQAMVDGLTIVTRDPQIAAYGVPVLWE